MSVHPENTRDVEVAEGTLPWREAFPPEADRARVGALALSTVAEVARDSEETTRIQYVELGGDWARPIEERAWF